MNCKEFVEAHPDKGDCFVYALNTPVEKGKQFSIILQKGKKETFLRIKIDKGLLAEIDSETIKCDYGFIRDQNSDYYFVELKGSDIAHAVEQLIRTIAIFKAKYQIQASQTYAYIASSSVPSAANQKFQRLQEEFKKKKIGVELKKQTNHYKHYVY